MCYVLHDPGLGFKLCQCPVQTVLKLSLLYIKLLRICAGIVSALLRRATAYRHQNRLQEAREDLKDVLRVEPHNDLAKVRTENGF